MAVIQYNLKVDKDGNYKVTTSVVEVEEGDKIQFRSNVSNAAIVYQQDPAFKEPDAPKAGEQCAIGTRNSTKGPFTVATTLTAANRVNFKCGQLVPPSNNPKPKPGETKLKFKDWRKGQGTPDVGN
ncbi:MAG TPA: hypothetical protein VH639_09830 [Bryobacteraceae bacterium]|jgi:hypothetical protein